MQNFQQQYENMKSKALQAISQIFPIEGKVHTLVVSNLHVEDLSNENYKEQMDLKLKGGTFGSPIVGTATLTDNLTKKVISNAKMKLGNIPRITPRGSYIIDGNEYQVANQLLLRPGIFHRVKENGELESFINVKGFQAKILFDPETAVFKLEKGTLNIKLLPLLIGLGVTPQEIQTAWGKETYEMSLKNSKSSPEAELAKLDKTSFGKAGKDAITASLWLSKLKLDPRVTTKTLQGQDALSPQVLLMSSKRLLDINRGTSQQDERDSLEFKIIRSVDDFVYDSFMKKLPEIKMKIRNNVDKRENVRLIINASLIGKPIKSFFTQSSLSSTTEQINPLNMIGETNKVVISGEGGIENHHSITDEARMAHPSQLGFIDPVHTPEKDVGVTQHMAIGALKEGNDLFTHLKNLKTGKFEKLRVDQSANAIISFADEFHADGTPKHAMVSACDRGVLHKVPAKSVEYILPSDKAMFDFASNLAPFLQSNSGNRAAFAGKQMEQALPLKYREAPLVQSMFGNNTTFEDYIGKGQNVSSKSAGVVTKVTPDEIYIGNDPHYLYNNFPLRSKQYLNHKALVKVGDKVKAGQTIAELNFNKGDTLALGTNLNVGYVSYKGHGLEDGVVITESASKKLTSEHMYKENLELDVNSFLDKKKFIANYPTAYTSAQLAKLDSEGIIKQGETVELGDPLIVHLHKEELTKDDIILSAFKKSAVRPMKNRSIEWNEEDRGKVVRIVRGPKSVEVQVQTEEVMKLGDKLSGRHGNKGIISKIIPDNEALVTDSGRRIDVYLNPHSVPGRINPSQNLELGASKIAEKTGHPYIADNFSSTNYLDKIIGELKQHKLQDKEFVTDPTTGKKLDNPIQTGQQYIMKLDHAVRKKFSSRGQDGYTLNMQPSSGGGVGGQSMDQLTLYSMLAHGANHNLKEMATFKSEKSDDFWNAYQSGLPLPSPKVPFVFDKFRAMLAASGVNMERRNDAIHLIPVTEADVTKMSHGEVTEAKAVKSKDLEPEAGGLFDLKLTGGLAGDKWSHIQLAEPMPMPMYEDAIITILGIDKKEFNDILSHKAFVNRSGELSTTETPGSVSGGLAIKRMMDRINLDTEYSHLNSEAKTAKLESLDKINRKMRYIKALRDNSMKLSDYLTSKIPVIPPKFRPIIQQKSGDLIISDANTLYKDLITVNNQLKSISYLPDSEKANLRLDTYNAMKALIGTGVSLTKKGTRDTKGFITQIAGSSPKEGFFQSKVLSKRQDFSGRSTIIPEPELSLDEVGIPDEMAWTVYRPHVIRALVRLGYNPIDARNAVEEHKDIAKRTLENEMKERPVFINRAPSLHKFSVMSFIPKMTTGKSIRLNPLVIGGFNADFDGDTMSVHVPVSEDARKESFGMLPSRNLYNPQTLTLEHRPAMEMLNGLYVMTLPPIKAAPVAFYNSVNELENAYKGHKVSVRDVVAIGKKVNTVGRILVNNALPTELRNDDITLDKKNINILLDKIAKTHEKDYGPIVSKLKDLGNAASYSSGVSFGLSDLKLTNPTLVRKEFQKLEQELAVAKNPVAWVQSFANKMKESAIIKEVHKDLTDKDSGLNQMMKSSLSGKTNQIEQMMVGPMFVNDHNEQPVPILIKHGYAEGLTASEYWTTMAGVRKGMMDRALATEDSGAFSKQMINSGLYGKITEIDCGTTEGINVNLDGEMVHAIDRYTAKGNPGVAANTLVKSDLVKRMKAEGIHFLKVRSPLTCKARNAPCAMCFGLREDGKLPRIGDNIGVIAAQSLSEPSVQLTMKKFHTGGSVGAKSIGGFDQAVQLLEMPKIVQDKAILSEVNGTVTKVNAAPQGGHYVSVGGELHYGLMQPIVKEGDKVLKGDRLTEGNIKPQELAALKNTLEAKKYIVDSIVDSYAASGRIVRRPLVETAVGQIVRYGQITDTGSDKNVVIGDYMPINELDFRNKELAKPIQYEEIVKGLKLSPEMSNDFLARMNFQHLQKSITQGAAQSWKSELHGTHPIPGYAYGAEFGNATTTMPDKTMKRVDMPSYMKKISHVQDMIDALRK